VTGVADERLKTEQRGRGSMTSRPSVKIEAGSEVKEGGTCETTGENPYGEWQAKALLVSVARSTISESLLASMAPRNALSASRKIFRGTPISLIWFVAKKIAQTIWKNYFSDYL
jgi:hypothetical protein